ncbi:MAG: 1-deoxy-D-xylulose-5-phosphate reductoisomerase [Acidimicrobiales bacterium]
MTIAVTLAGSTGSIGTQALDVIDTDPERYRVYALTAGSSWEAVVEQANRYRPDVVVLATGQHLQAARDSLPSGVEVRSGEAALRDVAARADVTINGIVGFAGLPATLACLEAGKRLGLANKESLIAAGPVVQRARRAEGAELVPVDSEHAAIHQCLRSNNRPRQIQRLQLTASGGPFRGKTADELKSVNVSEALDHPTWAMGPKITVDSATLMNKGLEVIEAVELFGDRSDLGTDLSFDDIDVVVHPQSIVHSMATFSDGSTIAQLSNPDMRGPIGYALAYPDRLGAPFGEIDWSQPMSLTFESPDREAFPCLDLACEAGRTGGTAPAWLSAANEVAVDAFLTERIGFVQIPAVVESVLTCHDGGMGETLEGVLEGDRSARAHATEVIARRF